MDVVSGFPPVGLGMENCGQPGKLLGWTKKHWPWTWRESASELHSRQIYPTDLHETCSVYTGPHENIGPGPRGTTSWTTSITTQNLNWFDAIADPLAIHMARTRENFEVVSQIPYRETSKNTAATSTSKNSSTMDKGWSWMFVFEAVHSIYFQPNSSTSILCALWIFADTWCHLVFFFFGFPGHFREFRDLWAEQRQRSFFQCLPWAPLKAWGLSILRPQWTFETLGLKFEWHC